MTTFAAIDFETANNYRDSACAVGLVIVSDGIIVQRMFTLIRPPTSFFQFTYIHGITWEDVENEGSFGEIWPNIFDGIKHVDFLVAHNASFDKGVLNACCSSHGILMPKQNFHCTVQIARKSWNIFPTKLPNVCNYLDIELNHHEALSDAEACARIVIAAEKAGWKP